MDYKLEAIMLPVKDVDAAKQFYLQAGFGLDVDHQAGEQFRVVQFTPQGSACSFMFGVGITDAEPGSVRGTHLVVTDIEAAQAELAGRGLEVSDVRHMTPNGFRPGVDPAHADYNSFADFTDPDGNTWGAAGERARVSQSIAGEAGFQDAAQRHRRELHVHCYRMLASFDEAEDAVQETRRRGTR